MGLHTELRALRESRGQSIARAAWRAGVSENALQGWETGRRAPRGPALERVLDALEAPSRLRARLLAETDPQHARLALAATPLGAPCGVGAVLRAMRERRGMTQADLARRVGVTQGAVAKWESGDSAPSAQRLHEVGFALGAAVEETLALASAQGGEPGGLPDEPGFVKWAPFDGLPSSLREIVSLAWEAELWRRAARDPRWDFSLCAVLGYRANQFVFDGRFAEIPALARRALRLATTPEMRVAAVPAVSALAAVSEHRGESPEAAAEAAGTWAEGIADVPHKAWMMRTRGMALARMGRGDEAAALIARSRDIDEEEPSYAAMGRFHAWTMRAESMAEMYLSLGMPRKAAETIDEIRRRPSFDQVLYARVWHANGEPLHETEMAYLRHWLLRHVAYHNWKYISALEEIECRQARLTGAEPVPVPRDAEILPHQAHVEESKRLWAKIPGAPPHGAMEP